MHAAVEWCTRCPALLPFVAGLLFENARSLFIYKASPIYIYIYIYIYCVGSAIPGPRTSSFLLEAKFEFPQKEMTSEKHTRFPVVFFSLRVFSVVQTKETRTFSKLFTPKSEPLNCFFASGMFLSLSHLYREELFQTIDTVFSFVSLEISAQQQTLFPFAKLICLRLMRNGVLWVTVFNWADWSCLRPKLLVYVSP